MDAEQEQKLINYVKNHREILKKRIFAGERNNYWRNCSNAIGVDAKACESKWTNLKRSYNKAIQEKKFDSITFTRLSFLELEDEKSEHQTDELSTSVSYTLADESAGYETEEEMSTFKCLTLENQAVDLETEYETSPFMDVTPVEELVAHETEGEAVEYEAEFETSPFVNATPENEVVEHQTEDEMPMFMKWIEASVRLLSNEDQKEFQQKMSQQLFTYTK